MLPGTVPVHVITFYTSLFEVLPGYTCTHNICKYEINVIFYHSQEIFYSFNSSHFSNSPHKSTLTFCFTAAPHAEFQSASKTF
jgi:hypothetical protein